MKNLIDPQILASFKKEPITHDRIAAFLESHSEVRATGFCRLIDVDPQKYFSWKTRQAKQSLASQSKGELAVIPTGGAKRKYSAEDKLRLVKRYDTLDGEARTEFLRKYGLYDSDFVRWLEKADSAALAALSTRKPRSDKKSPEQLENERLKAELRGQEKTIAKLSAIVVAQKKISDLLSRGEFD